MTQLQEIIAFNEKFVEEKQYEPYMTSKFPNKKMVVVTCMDTRLTELLPKALNIHNGDVKTIKNAGAIITQPFGNIMRSVLVALYELGASEVMVIGHHDCGMTGINPESTVGKMVDRGVADNTITTLKNSGLDLMRWLRGFDNVHSSVENSVNIIRNHPLLPPGTPVHGLIIDPETGKLDLVTAGYEIATTNA
ncbi:carbonic anhydrase [Paenibacillus sp. CCS19]|uniref:beta-class carbonic anhydrase n=1 Tax=Paenibacillus sp. CCS19 TaxID=3158387 RepID=UPI00256D2C55|nr:carbonic anhydrase [Paenibacillus cellulosilyticus]GMK41514.1 carbonic anhydrase [Paenibacillus cellulosilyticus]